MSDLPNFKYHPMCKGTKLTHHIFADELMVFCKGNVSLAARVMDTLHHFSEVTRLVVNLDMSNMFIVGAEEATKEQLLQLIGFALGTLPIRCLGLPLSSKKWNKLISISWYRKSDHYYSVICQNLVLCWKVTDHYCSVILIQK